MLSVLIEDCTSARRFGMIWMHGASQGRMSLKSMFSQFGEAGCGGWLGSVKVPQSSAIFEVLFFCFSPDSWQAIGVLTSLRWGSPVANF